MILTNEDKIVKSLETIAECLVKSTNLAEEAMKKNRELHEANMAMIRERYDKVNQINPKIVINKSPSLEEVEKFFNEPTPLTKEQLKSIEDRNEEILEELPNESDYMF